MKFIKSYKIFESSSEDLLDTINDIFISLDDLGIKYNIHNFENVGLIHIEIKAHSHGREKSEEINDCVDHLSNYLKDLGYEYFIGRSIENVTHISIENNFNKEIEKDFLKIIDDIREVKFRSTYYSWADSNDEIIFEQDLEDFITYYSFDKIFIYFRDKYNLNTLEIDGVFRYMIGKHLKIEAFSHIAITNRSILPMKYKKIQ